MMALQPPNIHSSNNKPGLIRSYLEDPNSSAELTAKEITTAAYASSVTKDEEGDCSLEGFLWELWFEVVEMIKYIPYNHPWQDKMVSLLSEIKEVPREVTPEMEELERGWGMYFWQDLPILGATMRETWNDGPLDDVSSITFFPPDVWANLNAFAARLTAASVLNFETYAIWILQHTLEEEVRDRVIDDNMPAAATWIAYAGWLLYHNALKEYPPSLGAPPPNIRYCAPFLLLVLVRRGGVFGRKGLNPYSIVRNCKWERVRARGKPSGTSRRSRAMSQRQYQMQILLCLHLG